MAVTAEPARRPASRHTDRRSWLERAGVPRVDQPGTGALVAAMTIDSLGSGLFVSFMLLYLTRIGDLSLGRAGLLLTVASGVALLANPVAGSLVDRFGPRTLVIVSQGLGAVGFLGLFGAGSTALLLAAALVINLGEKVFWVGFPTMIVNIAPREQHDAWFGLSGMIRNAGLGVGGLVAGLVIWLLGEDGYRVLLGANVVSFLAAGALIARRVPNVGGRDETEDEAHGGYRDLLADRPALLVAAATAIFALCAMVIFFALPIYAVDVLGLGEWVPGMLLAVNTAVLTLAQTVALRVVGGWRRTRAFVLAAGLWVGASALFAGALAVPAGALLGYMVVSVALYSVAELFFAPVSGALGAAMAPAALRGRYMALLSFAWGIAATAGPAFFTGLLALGDAVPWAALAVLATAGGGISLWVERRIPEEVLRSRG